MKHSSFVNPLSTFEALGPNLFLFWWGGGCAGVTPGSVQGLLRALPLEITPGSARDRTRVGMGTCLLTTFLPLSPTLSFPSLSLELLPLRPFHL